MERSPRLWRKRRDEGGILLGLCAGIGDHLGIDPVLVRLALVILVCLNYAGLAVIVIYLIFGLLVPYQPSSSS